MGDYKGHVLSIRIASAAGILSVASVFLATSVYHLFFAFLLSICNIHNCHYILASVHDQRIDISDACNRALADLTGIDYRQQQLDTESPITPVIIASDGKLISAAADPVQGHRQMRPVLNADDPLTPATVYSRKEIPPSGRPERRGPIIPKGGSTGRMNRHYLPLHHFP
jgi:hypothetical protein